MRTICQTDGDWTQFVVADLGEAYYSAALRLEFQPVPEGLARSFPSNSPHLRRAYENFARYVEELIRQRAGAQPVPWERALEGYLEIVAGTEVNWYLVGSTALAVRGLEIAPGDIDLVTDEVGAHSLAELLLDFLIEPVVPVDAWISDWFGRSFFHADVEWVGGVNERADTPEISDFGPVAATRLEPMHWRGHELWVPPLDLQRDVSRRRGLDSRVAQIDRFLADSLTP
jgi:hypothetical protein